jgi:hypothetical protein
LVAVVLVEQLMAKTQFLELLALLVEVGVVNLDNLQLLEVLVVGHSVVLEAQETLVGIIHPKEPLGYPGRVVLVPGHQLTLTLVELDYLQI